MMQDQTIYSFWVIRAGKGGAAHNLFIKNGLVVLSDAGLGNLLKLNATRSSFYATYRELHPDKTRSGIAQIGGKYFRFLHEIAIGDYVLYPSLSDKQIYVGLVTGEYSYKKLSKYPHRRTVSWINKIPKSEFSIPARRELGAARTLFEFKNNTQELITKMHDNTFGFSFSL